MHKYASAYFTSVSTRNQNTHRQKSFTIMLDPEISANQWLMCHLPQINAIKTGKWQFFHIPICEKLTPNIIFNQGNEKAMLCVS